METRGGLMRLEDRFGRKGWTRADEGRVQISEQQPTGQAGPPPFWGMVNKPRMVFFSHKTVEKAQKENSNL